MRPLNLLIGLAVALVAFAATFGLTGLVVDRGNGQRPPAPRAPAPGTAEVIALPKAVVIATLPARGGLPELNVPPEETGTGTAGETIDPDSVGGSPGDGTNGNGTDGNGTDGDGTDGSGQQDPVETPEPPVVTGGDD